MLNVLTARNARRKHSQILDNIGMTDPTSDMFIRIKNAQKAGHETVQLPYSKFKYEILKVLERSGWVGSIERKGKRVKKILEVTLLYAGEGGVPLIGGVSLISKPSRRIYSSYKEIRPAKHGGVVIISTSKGLMTTMEAKKAKLGGQLITEVW